MIKVSEGQYEPDGKSDRALVQLSIADPVKGEALKQALIQALSAAVDEQS